jgi:hypothetical protein
VKLVAECAHVREAVAAEASCATEACQFGARLAEDWVHRCSKAAPDSRAQVAELARTFEERRKGARLPCLRDIEPLLKNGCSGAANCADTAQAWLTRCSDQTKSPLLVRILEARLAQAGAGSTPLDARSCDEVSAALVAASACKQQFECKDGLPALEAYRKRCLNPDGLGGIRQGFAELSLRLGAQAPVTELAVSLESPLEPGQVGLQLADGSGVVISVCDERVRDLAQYLSARHDCSEGFVVMARRQSTARHGRTQLRVAKLLVASDEKFHASYPSLLVTGEAEARSSAALERVASQLTVGLERATGGDAAGKAVLDKAEALKLLLQTLSVDASVLERPDAAQALAAADARLAPVLRDVAKAKLAYAQKLFKPLEYVAFVARALHRPLADVDENGVVVLGAKLPAATRSWEAVLPSAAAAYSAEIAPLAERLKKKPPSAQSQEKLGAELTSTAKACADAEQTAERDEVDLTECGFSGGCDDEVLESLRSELAKAQAEATQAHQAATLAASSLEPAPPASWAEHCAAPWW